jgi:competence protein ComEA
MGSRSGSSEAQQRAAAFVVVLLLLSTAARWLDRPRVDLGGAAGIDLAAHEAAVRGNIAEPRGRGLQPGETIDPNSADARTLERLPRVGPALAARIVAERERAPFESVEDLRRVPGIGAAMVEALAPMVALPRQAAGPAAGRGGGTAGGTAPGAGAGTAAAPVAGVRPAAPARAGSHAPDAPIDVNRATAEELVRLPGVGPVLAARIVAYRDTAGPFRSVEQLERVSGIGPALRARIAPNVVVR